MLFNCSCIFCQEDGEDESDLAFYEEFANMEKEVKKLINDRCLHTRKPYSDSKCRKEVDLHRKMYKLGREKSCIPTFLFESLECGVEAAIFGKNNAEKQESKEAFSKDCEIFLKAAENYEKILGNDRVAQCFGTADEREFFKNS